MTKLRADLMLVLVTLGWGVSYYLIDVCVADLGPITLNMFRFSGAFLIAMVLAFPKLKTVNKTTLRYSFYVSIALVVTYMGATYGVMYTSLSNAGFLCALAVVFTPILEFFIKKKRPESKLAIVILICFIGIALLTLNNQLRPALGDVFCLICSVAYSIDLILTETAVKKETVNAFHLGVYQLGFVGAIFLVLAFVLEKPHLPSNDRVWFAVVFLAIFCTGIAFIVQAIAQQYTTASHVGVIFTLEPVFAGFVAFFLAGEVLLPRAYFGAALLLAGLFIMETDFGKLKRGRIKTKEDKKR